MRTLLIDTCGDGASIALVLDAEVIASRELPARAASALLLSEIRSSLAEAGWAVSQIKGIGVVNGPGSFTGVRVGLSCAKGLCEALGIPLAVVSRLQVLANSGKMTSGYAVLNAGRGELFVRDIAEQREFLDEAFSFSERSRGARIVVAEEFVLTKLNGISTELHPLSAKSSLALVLQRLANGGDDVSLADANYIRSEQQIYGKSTAASNAAL